MSKWEAYCHWKRFYMWAHKLQENDTFANLSNVKHISVVIIGTDSLCIRPAMQCTLHRMGITSKTVVFVLCNKNYIKAPKQESNLKFLYHYWVLYLYLWTRRRYLRTYAVLREDTHTIVAKTWTQIILKEYYCSEDLNDVCIGWVNVTLWRGISDETND